MGGVGGFDIAFVPVVRSKFDCLYLAGHYQETFAGRFPRPAFRHFEYLFDEKVALGTIVGRKRLARPPAGKLGTVFQLYQYPFSRRLREFVVPRTWHGVDGFEIEMLIPCCLARSLAAFKPGCASTSHTTHTSSKVKLAS